MSLSGLPIEEIQAFARGLARIYACTYHLDPRIFAERPPWAESIREALRAGLRRGFKEDALKTAP